MLLAQSLIAHIHDWVGGWREALTIYGENEVVKEISIKHIYEIAYKNKLPLSSAILTVKNLEQALERADIKKRNLGGKAAEVCLNLMKEI